MEENRFIDGGEGIVWVEKKEPKLKTGLRKILIPVKFFNRVTKRFAGAIYSKEKIRKHSQSYFVWQRWSILKHFCSSSFS